jgi:hypothetical protein
MNMADEVQSVRSFGRYNAGKSIVYRATNVAELRNPYRPTIRRRGSRAPARHERALLESAETEWPAFPLLLTQQDTEAIRCVPKPRFVKRSR